jgi:HK97 family phage major capsid protein
MSDTNKDAIQEVMEAVTQLREHNDKLLAAKADGKAVGDLTAKVEKISDALDGYENLNQKITTSEAQAKAMQEQVDRLETILNRANAAGGLPGADDKKAQRELEEAFEHCLRTRHENRDQARFNLVQRYKNTLVKGDDASAGYLMAPPEMERAILKDLIEQSPIRQIATVRTIGGHSYKWPKRTGTASASRVGEIQTRNSTQDPKYGLGEILAPEMFARNPVSVQMLEDSDYDLLGELRMEVTEQCAVKEGAESVNGVGSSAQQMEGLLVASGIGEVVSGNGSAITADGLINLQYELKTGYARNAVFILNRKTIRDIRKLKDSQGVYIWMPGVANAAPNTILGSSYVEFPDMPDIAANAYPVMWGDFKRGYTMVDRVGLGFQADYLTEADNGLVIYRARKRVGGGVKMSDAIKKLKIST